MKRFIRLWSTTACTALLLSGCGGDSGNIGDYPGGSISTPAPAPAPTPTPTAGCSVRERQNWAADQMREWYLFPETLPTTLDPSGYSTVDAYIDALTANARGLGKDRYFTYLTSIAEENAYYSSGSSAGLGLRLATDSTQRRVFVTEAFEGGPGLAAGIDRGAEIMAIGTTSANMRTVSAITGSEGLDGVTNALGPDTTGTTRILRIDDASGTRDVSVTKRDFDITPVSNRYGAQILTDSGRQVGYVNLRTFITTAGPALRDAFARFRSQGVTDVIVDLRYNGGGLVSVATLLGDLLGGGRSTSDVLTRTTFRPEKASENETRYFASQPESIAPTRIAFIGMRGTASASELVINSFIPYLNANAGLIGTNTYGKPVGQIALDRSACDDRLRVVAFATQNSAGNSNYFGGLAGSVRASCQAPDDIGYQLGDPREASTRQALDFLAGASCTPISGTVSSQSVNQQRRDLLTPQRPGTAQREVPGLF